MNSQPHTTPRRAQGNTSANREPTFDPLNREWFSLKLAAQECGMGESFLEKKFDEGREISGHAHNAGTGQRVTKRIPKVWLVAYLLTTARYDNAALVAALTGCFRRLSLPLLERIRAAADEEIRRRSSDLDAAPRNQQRHHHPLPQPVNPS